MVSSTTGGALALDGVCGCEADVVGGCKKVSTRKIVTVLKAIHSSLSLFLFSLILYANTSSAYIAAHTHHEQLFLDRICSAPVAVVHEMVVQQLGHEGCAFAAE